MVRVFLGFHDGEHRLAVLEALERLGPWPEDTELVVPEGGGAYLEADGYDMEGAYLLIERRLMVALAGTGMHPDGVALLTLPPGTG
jgi:hypothetical protein